MGYKTLIMNNTDEQADLLVKMTLTAWDGQNKQLIKLLDTLTDEQLHREIAPGKNTGTYLLGHLVAVSDGMLPLLGFGDRLFPELDEVFLKNPDKSGLPQPPVAMLKDNLHVVNSALAGHFNQASVADWLGRHTAVSAEDFANAPHRNKLNVVISRTNHLANHIGQLLLLK